VPGYPKGPNGEDLPDVHQILMALQEYYGLNVRLGPRLIAQLDYARALGSMPSDPGGWPKPGGPWPWPPPWAGGIPAYGCFPNDACIACDTSDLCSTCDTMDWCVSTDYHRPKSSKRTLSREETAELLKKVMGKEPPKDSDRE
jgi:hypothetical protein